MDSTTSIELFINEDNEGESVALVLRDPSILDYEGDLTPGYTMSPDQARALADELRILADQAEES